MAESEVLNFFISTGFILLGSIAFYISTLISGYSIYRELDNIEATLMSVGVGLIVFWFSPVSFAIMLSQSTSDGYIPLLHEIFHLDVLISILCSASGLGFIFGSLIILDVRSNIVSWLRNRLGLPIRMRSYSILWDDFFAGTKKGARIKIVTSQDNNRELEGTIKSFSIRDEPREIQLILDDEKYPSIIPGDNIRQIKVNRKFFKKHYEPLAHIGQAIYFFLAGVGFILISISTYIVSNNKYIIDDIVFESAYINATIVCHFVSLIFILLSLWVASKDHINLESYLCLCSEYILLCEISIFLILSASISYLILVLGRSNLFNLIYIYCSMYPLLPVAAEVAGFYYGLKIDLIRNFEDLLNQSVIKDNRKIAEKVVKEIYLNLDLNSKEELPSFELFTEKFSNYEIEIAKNIYQKITDGITMVKREYKFLEGENGNLLGHLDRKSKIMYNNN